MTWVIRREQIILERCFDDDEEAEARKHIARLQRYYEGPFSLSHMNDVDFDAMLGFDADLSAGKLYAGVDTLRQYRDLTSHQKGQSWTVSR